MNPLRLLLFSALIIFMLLVLLVGLNWGDEPPPNDEDLLPVPAVIQPEEDGYPFLVKAIAAFEGISDSGRIAEPAEDQSDDEWLREELLKHEEALRLLKEAVECPAIHLPSSLTSFGIREDLGSIREMARVVSAQARVSLRQSSGTNEGLEEIHFGVRFGRLLAEGGTGMIDLLTGIALQGMALESLREGVPHLPLNAGQTRDFIRTLERERFARETLASNLRGEYVLTKEMHNLMLRGLAPSGGLSFWHLELGYSLKPNKTMRMIGERYRTVISLVAEPYYHPEEWPDEDMELERSLPLENHTGRTLIEISLPTLSRVMLSAFLHEANFGSTQLLVALTAYERAEGDLPDSLDQLVGIWIDALPMDPFSGEALRYSKADRMVFTVGPEKIEEPSLVVTAGRDRRGFILPDSLSHAPNP